MSEPTPHATACEHDKNMPSPLTDCCAVVFAIADDTRITATQFRVFTLIAKGYCKRADMAAKAGKSIPTIARAIDALIKLGLIEREIIKGKASKLAVSGRIMDASRILSDTATQITGDTPTRITGATGITHEPTTRITDDTGSVDNSGGAYIGTGARAETLTNINTYQLELNSERAKHFINSSSDADVDAKPVRILNGSAKGMQAHELSSKLIEIMDSPSLSARNARLAGTCQEIKNWISDGADFDTDIVPTVMDLTARQKGKQIYSWRFFTNAVRDNVTARIALENYTPNPITAESANVQRHRSSQQQRPGQSGDSFTQFMLKRATGSDEIDIGRVDSITVE